MPVADVAPPALDAAAANAVMAEAAADGAPVSAAADDGSVKVTLEVVGDSVALKLL